MPTKIAVTPLSVEISSMPLAPLVSFSSGTTQNSLFDIIY
jgi:hypothetical protein